MCPELRSVNKGVSADQVFLISTPLMPMSSVIELQVENSAQSLGK